MNEKSLHRSQTCQRDAAPDYHSRRQFSLLKISGSPFSAGPSKLPSVRHRTRRNLVSVPWRFQHPLKLIFSRSPASGPPQPIRMPMNIFVTKYGQSSARVLGLGADEAHASRLGVGGATGALCPGSRELKKEGEVSLFCYFFTQRAKFRRGNRLEHETYALVFIEISACLEAKSNQRI